MRANPSRAFAFRLLAALLLGAVSVLAYAPVGWFPLVFLTLGGLFALLGELGDGPRRSRDGALIGAAFGAGLFIAGVSWVYVSLSVFGGMPTPVAALATLLFCLVLAGFPAAAAALFVRLAPVAWLPRALIFAALWTLAEYLRGWVLTGFPWLAVGYAQGPPSPLAGFAPVFGVYGLTLLSALLAALSCEVVRRWLAAAPCAAKGWLRWCPALPLLTIGSILLLGGLLREMRWTQVEGGPVTVALLQGNIAQDLKWRPERFEDSLRAYYRLALENPAQLTVLPETALPAFLDQVPVEYLEAWQALAEQRRGDVLFGIAVGDGDAYVNAAVSLGVSPGQRYSKSHLVPFGEFVPPGFAWLLAMAHIPMSNFTPGALRQPPLDIAGQRVAVNICYEDAFGDEIIRALPAASLLVNLSNVAWFGDSLAPAQHLQIAQMRALESGRMMLRATNTGMTAIVGVDGVVQSSLPPFTRAALVGEVRGYAGATPFVRWGNGPVIAFALLLVALLARRRR